MRFRSLMASSAKEEAIRDNRMFAECVFYCTTNATGELYPPCCIAPNFSTLREQFDQFLHFQQILHTVIINLTGTITAVIPAAATARIPLKESSIPIAFSGKTPTTSQAFK